MFKSLLSVASLAILLALSPVHAQQKMSCTGADMAKMEAEATKITDAQKKEMAMKEMKMAKDMMGQKKMDECTTHMDNATKMMTK